MSAKISVTVLAKDMERVEAKWLRFLKSSNPPSIPELNAALNKALKEQDVALWNGEYREVSDTCRIVAHISLLLALRCDIECGK